MLSKKTRLENSLFSCFERVNWFFGFMWSIYLLFSISFVSLKFLGWANLVRLSRWLISLVGPGSPTLTSTMSSPFGRTINWFFRVWFSAFPKNFSCSSRSEGRSMGCSVLSTVNEYWVSISRTHSKSPDFF